MNAGLILLIIAGYFSLLYLISYFTAKNASNDAFFRANRKSPWFLVAFGMIGSSLSGVTFISVPGWVAASQFSYMQVVLGYLLGYLVIATVLLPLYYKLNLTSIYTYLGQRFGNVSYRTGAFFFLISRLVGSCLRLYLVANVLQLLIFDALNIPFWVTVSITIAIIWLYTFRSGIKTVVYTDTLQTLFMLVSLGLAVYYLSHGLGLSMGEVITYVRESPLSKTFFFDTVQSSSYFWKQFVSGALIAIVMTGLDQDMMQKNLTCRNLKDAQKNMFWFSVILALVNLTFLILGLLLSDYVQGLGIDVGGDDLFPTVATQLGLPAVLSVFFILGLIAAAYSSADGTLAALTTSFCIDILDIENRYETQKQVRIRKRVHVSFSILSIIVILMFGYLVEEKSIINKVLEYAGYTYGPLLGLFAFGVFTRRNIKDRWVPLVAILSPILTILINSLTKNYLGFDFGFLVLLLNGLLTITGLLILTQRK